MSSIRFLSFVIAYNIGDTLAAANSGEHPVAGHCTREHRYSRLPPIPRAPIRNPIMFSLRLLREGKSFKPYVEIFDRFQRPSGPLTPPEGDRYWHAESVCLRRHAKPGEAETEQCEKGA
jgi:hypothetical protein